MSDHTASARACQRSDTDTVTRAADMSPLSGDRSVNHSIAARFNTALLSEGYTALPNLAWRYYARLDVSEAEFVFIGQLCTYWWGPGNPFPGEEEIARRMGKSKRCIQGYVKSLERKGMLRVSPRFSGRGRQYTNSYDLRPFFQAVEGIARIDGTRGSLASAPSSNARTIEANATLPLPTTDIPITLTDEEMGAEGMNESSPHENPIETHHFAFELMPLTPMTPHDTDCKRFGQGCREGQDAGSSLMDLAKDQNLALEAVIQSLGAELGDDTPVSSLSRARNLRSSAGVSPHHFLQLVDAASARTRACQDRIIKRHREAADVPNAMPYFFAVLTDLLRPAQASIGADQRRAARVERHRSDIRREASNSWDSLNGSTERPPIMERNPVWRAALEELALVLTVENFNTWLAPTRVLAQEGDLLRVIVPRQFHKDWLEAKLNGRVMNTLQRLGYQSMCVEYVVEVSA